MVMPSAFRVNEKPAKTSITSAVAIQVRRGRRPTPFATFDQTPESRSSVSSTLGIFGQKTQLPDGKFCRLNGPQPGRVTRKIPKIIQPITVMPAKAPPMVMKGPIGMSVTKLNTRPMMVGTKNAKIGSTTLGIIKRAGKNVSITSRAATMPAAPTGPRDLFEFNSLSSRHINPMITVAPLATIGSTTPLRAARIAAACCSW